MRQFRTNYDLVHAPVDIVITPDDQVWVTIHPPQWGTWNAYEKIEDLRAKDYDRPGSTRGRARSGSGARSGRASYGSTGRGYIFDESHEFHRDRDPVVDYGMVVHEMMEKYFTNKGPDIFPISGQIL